jgi:hypothetical protein
LKSVIHPYSSIHFPDVLISCYSSFIGHEDHRDEDLINAWACYLTSLSLPEMHRLLFTLTSSERVDFLKQHLRTGETSWNEIFEYDHLMRHEKQYRKAQENPEKETDEIKYLPRKICADNLFRRERAFIGRVGKFENGYSYFLPGYADKMHPGVAIWDHKRLEGWGYVWPCDLGEMGEKIGHGNLADYGYSR